MCSLLRCLVADWPDSILSGRTQIDPGGWFFTMNWPPLINSRIRLILPHWLQTRQKRKANYHAVRRLIIMAHIMLRSVSCCDIPVSWYHDTRTYHDTRATDHDTRAMIQTCIMRLIWVVSHALLCLIVVVQWPHSPIILVHACMRALCRWHVCIEALCMLLDSHQLARSCIRPHAAHCMQLLALWLSFGWTTHLTGFSHLTGLLHLAEPAALDWTVNQSIYTELSWRMLWTCWLQSNTLQLCHKSRRVRWGGFATTR